MKYLIIVLLLIGAVITYLSKFIFKLIKKREGTNEEVVKIKIIGLVFVLAGAFLTFMKGI